MVNWAAEVATDGPVHVPCHRGLDKGLPALAAKMEVNVVTPEEQAKFAEAAQPAVRALIEEQYGEEGIDDARHAAVFD
jgi:TRAP-type C4-dicarboxylate transport system substrate-binding protein